MKHTKEVFIRIVSLDEVKDEEIYKCLHKNIDNSYIEIHKVDKITYKDIKN